MAALKNNFNMEKLKNKFYAEGDLLKNNYMNNEYKIEVKSSF
jgi:hypothetical protein